MRGDVVILTLAVSLAYLQYSSACSCLKTHPQTHYCQSDFVILARVKRERSFNDTLVYKVRVRKSYKMSEKAPVALKSGRILTAAEEAMCGIKLSIGELYAISGRVNSLKAYVSLCDMAIPWKNLTRRQRKGLKAIYKHGCDCTIKNCMWWKCTKTPDSCIQNSKCHTKEGICLRQMNKKCMWTRNRALSTCLKTELKP